MKYLIHVVYSSLYSLKYFFSLLKIVTFVYVHSSVASFPENINITGMCVKGGLGLCVCVCTHVCMCWEIKDGWKEPP